MADSIQEYTLKVLAAVRSVSDQLRAMRTTRLPFKEASAAQQVAAGAMLRVPGLATAVVLLIENKLVLECEPIIRSLLETAINVAWIGTDDARAQLFKADSARQLRLWLSEVEKNQPIPDSAKVRPRHWLQRGKRAVRHVWTVRSSSVHAKPR